MDMRIWTLLTLVSLTLPVGVLAEATDEAPTGKSIMNKVADRKRPTDSKARMTMVLVNKRGDKRERSVEISTKEVDGRSKSFVRFLEPADVRGTSFLTIEEEDGGETQILYLPALKKTRRIASSQKSQSFMGTDFSYEDLSVTDVDKDADHKLLREEEVDGHDTFVVESIPRPEKESSYSKIINWVRKDIYLPIKAEFYDEKGEKLKELTVRKVEDVEGYMLPTQSRMFNVQKETQTFLITPKETFEVDTGLEDDIFTERNMTTP